jgi:hypothetical protein
VQQEHDKYDATQLALLYRAGELTTARIPSEAEERVRDTVRCRETVRSAPLVGGQRPTRTGSQLGNCKSSPREDDSA